MSWIKPNFLWMMFRSGWGTKENQQRILAIRIRRTFFESVLEQAVPSTYDADLFVDHQSWRQALVHSDVRLQWDHDHDPKGRPLARRGIQLGLRGEVLKEYAQEAILEIIDLSNFVRVQRRYVYEEDYGKLQTPQERVYLPKKKETIRKLKLFGMNKN